MDPYFLRHNERVKTLTAVVSNLGAAALGYGIGKIANGSQEPLSLGSVVGAFVLFYAAYRVLEQLEVEGVE